MGEEVPTPHLRWENPFLFPQAKQFSHYLGLCTMPFKKVEGPSRSLLVQPTGPSTDPNIAMQPFR